MKNLKLFPVKLLLIPILFLGCLSSPDNDTEVKSVTDTLVVIKDYEPGETVKVTYKTGGQAVDVFYCNETGSISGEFNVTAFKKDIDIEIGGRACISIIKLNEKNNINVKASIFVDDSLVIEDSGKMRASAEVGL